jgi:hypothetical protein
MQILFPYRGLAERYRALYMGCGMARMKQNLKKNAIIVMKLQEWMK